MSNASDRSAYARRTLRPWRTRVALWVAPWLLREINDLREAYRCAVIRYQVTRDV